MAGVEIARKLWPRTILIMCILYTGIQVSVGEVGIDMVTAKSQTVNEGERAVLHCYFTPANADIGKWYWKTNGSAITRSDQPDPKSRYSLANATDGTGNASLIIKSVTRWDKGKYICGVDDESKGSTVAQHGDSTLTVYYMENPKLEAPDENYLPGGAKVSLKCKLALSYPEVTTINWFHGNKKIEDDSDKYSIEDNILEVTQFDKRDEGNYTCRAENEIFENNKGKSSNSIMLSLRKEATISSMSIAWIPVTFIIVFGIIAFIAFVRWKKKQSAKLEDDICQAVTNLRIRSKEARRIDRDISDFDIRGTKFAKALDFGRQSLQMERGDSIKITFNSTYNSEHWCFQEDPGYFKPFFCINLELHQFEEDKMLYKSGDIKEDNCKRSSEFGLNKFHWEVNKIKNGVKGHIALKNTTDDDEGIYICKLKIIWESRMCLGAETKFTFFGKTSISISNVIFRNIKTNTQLRPIRMILNGNFYVFVEDNSEIWYIMSEYDKTCEDTKKNQPHQTLNCPALTWNDNADFLMESNKMNALSSFAILPGIRIPYIVIGFISHEKKILQNKLVAIFPKRSPQFHVISGVLESLHSDGHVMDLKFDNLSGMKLSTGRLVVGGWIKRNAVDNYQISRKKVKYFGARSTEDDIGIENQSYEYEPFIMWTDDEINWNLLNLKMDNAEDNMRFQITETGPNMIHVIISSLSSKQILCEGTSDDNFQTFRQKTDQCSEVPLVSFALSAERLFVCASPFYKSNYTSIERKQSGEASVGDTTDSGEVRSKYKSSLFGRIFSRSESSAGQSIKNIDEPAKDQETENKDITEESSLITDAASSKKTSEAPLDFVADTRLENSFEGTSDDVKKRKNVKKGTGKSSISAKTKKKSKSKSGTGINYEAVPTIEKDNEETLKRDEKDDSSETQEQEDGIMDESESQAKKSLAKTESQEKDDLTENKQKSEETERKDESVTSDLERQSKSLLKTSKTLKKRKGNKRTAITGKSRKQSNKADEQAPDDDSEKAEDITDAMSGNDMTSGGTEGSSKKSRSGIRNVLATLRFMPKLKSSTPSKPEEAAVIPTPESPTEWENRELGGLWHLIQDTTDNTAIRVRPIRDGDQRDYGQVTILKNRSQVKLNQILPFTHEDRSLFLMIYSTDFHREGDVSTWRCTRYHVFSVDDLFK